MYGNEVIHGKMPPTPTPPGQKSIGANYYENVHTITGIQNIMLGGREGQHWQNSILHQNIQRKLLEAK